MIKNNVTFRNMTSQNLICFKKWLCWLSRMWFNPSYTRKAESLCNSPELRQERVVTSNSPEQAAATNITPADIHKSAEEPRLPKLAAASIWMTQTGDTIRRAQMFNRRTHRLDAKSVTPFPIPCIVLPKYWLYLSSWVIGINYRIYLQLTYVSTGGTVINPRRGRGHGL